MSKAKPKSQGYIIYSIIAGLACSIITFVFLILLFIATGLFGWSDGGEKEYLERLEMTTNITFFISILVAVFVGIYVIVRMSKVKKSDTASSPPDTLSQ
jgi:uncharacterized membrane protein